MYTRFNGLLLSRGPQGEQWLPFAVVVGWILLTLARLVAAGQIELLPEEAYYWTYFQHPALSYFDHPPMVAWVIGLGTSLFGNTEFGVRVGFVFMSLGSAALMFDLARRWVGSRAGWWAAALLGLVPIYFMTGLLAFPDGPLIFFWLLTMHGVTRVVVDETDSGWFWAGIGFGGALLSKYTAVTLAASVLLFLLLSPAHRHWLKRPHPWLAVGLGLMMFMPVIVWNGHHEWVSFLFQSTRTHSSHNNMATSVAVFWLFQFAVLTPPVLLLLARSLRRWDGAGKFAIAFAAPLFLILLRASFKTKVHINWSAPVYLSLLPVAAALLVQKHTGSTAWRRISWITASALVLLGVTGLATMALGQARVLSLAQIGGWRSLADGVEQAEHELEAQTGLSVFVLGFDKYNLAAEIGFYSGEPEEQVNNYALGYAGLGFRYWTELEEWRGHPSIVVLQSVNETTLKTLRAYFDQVEKPQRLEVAGPGNSLRGVYLVKCHGYRLPAT
jgi:dolichol-phosphate mannosyltransferase